MTAKVKEARSTRKLVAIMMDIIEGRNMHGLTLAEVDILADCINQITESKRSTTKTFSSSVAAIFRQAEFRVTAPHDYEVNYTISL